MSKDKQFTLEMEPSKRTRPDPRNALNDLTNTEWMYLREVLGLPPIRMSSVLSCGKNREETNPRG